MASGQSIHEYLKSNLGRIAGVAERTTISMDSADSVFVGGIGMGVGQGDTSNHDIYHRHSHHHRKLHDKVTFRSAQRLQTIRNGFIPFDSTATKNRISGIMDELVDRAISRHKVG